MAVQVPSGIVLGRPGQRLIQYQTGAIFAQIFQRTAADGIELTVGQVQQPVGFLQLRLLRTVREHQIFRLLHKAVVQIVILHTTGTAGRPELFKTLHIAEAPIIHSAAEYLGADDGMQHFFIRSGGHDPHGTSFLAQSAAIQDKNIHCVIQPHNLIPPFLPAIAPNIRQYPVPHPGIGAIPRLPGCSPPADSP